MKTNKILCDSCKKDITNEVSEAEIRELGATGWSCDECAEEQERIEASNKYNAERRMSQAEEDEADDFNSVTGTAGVDF